ncbi:DEAD/DEAH box helicase [Methylobacterium nodulans]|uniref:DEAD/DEAH box helicase domain protein n=1 Tax=Methylobacterium nodulans (strain LMG 21967 / CNCM I-2342 / ORS 2060) TaxID=460265 RepID=B8IW51_METNO|nr:DEAD/DEAH box helicase [Methylobacterium nodulans]ACL62641.1 DEAD/DEAH box helicase domain protein [Methylobacterium nodulans ORS 2060]
MTRQVELPVAAGRAEEASRAFDRLAEPVRRWIWQQGWSTLRDVQERAVPAILAGGDVILAARTAAGKTEAAFLPLLSRVLPKRDGGRPGFSLLYVSPLKALINDQFRRLESLLEACDMPLHRWHGDVSADAKRRARERPQGVVLITPESLEATLVRRGREAPRLFGALDAIVIDELHAFIGTERGRQLQSVLSRIEACAGRDRIDRVGLSATLGDMDLAREALRPGASDAVTLVESQEGGTELLLQIRGYERPLRQPTAPPKDRLQQPSGPGPNEEREAASAVPDLCAVEAIQTASLVEEPVARHLFEVLRGRRNLLFAGSRQNVEIYTDRLRALSEAARLPNEFFAHHGNLSRAERETVELRLREDARPTTAVATTTLELGIDIGDVESVAQIGPGWSVSSLRQRLGRSGRRPGKPAVLRIYVIEDEAGPTLHPADRLRLDLVQAVAMVELLLERWCEPPRTRGLHLSTLVHQTLALIVQTGGLRPGTAWQLLCEHGPFRNVSRDLFVEVLRSMARPEAELVEMSPDGLLMLGPRGERLTAGHDFFAVFQSPEEYRIVEGSRPLGTVPLDTTLAPGQTIIFAGRRWCIETVDERAKVVVVIPTNAALPPRFDGSGAGLHDRVAAAMRACLSGTHVPPFLDAGARTLLGQARDAFFAFGLDRGSIVEVEGDCVIFPWAGSPKLETLTLALRTRHFQASPFQHVIEVRDCSARNLRAALAEIAGSPPPDGHELARFAVKPMREKYDAYLTEALLVQAMTVERLEAQALPGIARLVLDPPFSSGP